MITQVRIYTVNRGMLDAWVEFFNQHIAPGNQKYGMTIHGVWINRPQNEFIWVRSYENEDVVTAWNNSPERAAVADQISLHLAKTEVREVEAVSVPAKV